MEATAQSTPSPNPSKPAAPKAASKESGGLGIYKYGQGYWVRVFTAVFAAIMFLGAARWSWQELDAISLPTPTFKLRFTQDVSAPAKVGDLCVLYDSAKSPPEEIGRCSVVSATASEVVIGSLELNASPDPNQKTRALSEADRLQTTDGTMAADISERVGIPIFNKAYLQASVAAFFLLGGATLIYWFVAVRPGTVDFLVDTDGEMKKVNWSTRKAILDTTWVVIAATFLIAAALYIFDVLWSEFMRVVGVLHA